MTKTDTAGYSGTPLARKLGFQEGIKVLLVDAPADYETHVSPLPPGVGFAKRPGTTVGMAHVFVTDRKVLGKQLVSLRAKLRPDAAVWVSWPKKSAKMPTTVTEDVIRELALPLGFVDVKVCAVTDVWSGLKLVVRKELR